MTEKPAPHIVINLDRPAYQTEAGIRKFFDIYFTRKQKDGNFAYWKDFLDKDKERVWAHLTTASGIIVGNIGKYIDSNPSGINFHKEKALEAFGLDDIFRNDRNTHLFSIGEQIESMATAYGVEGLKARIALFERPLVAFCVFLTSKQTDIKIFLDQHEKTRRSYFSTGNIPVKPPS